MARLWTRLAAFVALLLATTAGAPAAEKISDGVVKIGVMNDGSGAYSDITGKASLLATQMAVEDFGGKVLGKPIEVVYADHQNKPDVASSKAREWYDKEKVDIIMDLPTSSCALAVVNIAKELQRLAIVSGGGTTRITNENCNEFTVHWTYDTYSLAAGTTRSVVKNGGLTWFFMTADYAFGASMEKDAFEFIKAAGGKVLGSARYPFPTTTDFASFLLQAQSSGAQVIGLANAGSDTINTVKQAAEFGITPAQRLAPLLIFINDVHSLGLAKAQGLYLTEGFYWDLDDATRAWSKRFFDRHKAMPNMIQAGLYSATMHYLKAVNAAGTDEPRAVMAMMRKTPVNDFFAKNGRIRQDGRLMHDMYLFEVKKPAESKGPWDYYHVRRVIPAEEAAQPLEKSLCPLVTKK